MTENQHLNWDYKNPHILYFNVTSENIDLLGHVNNKVYLDWCELVSLDHSRFLGVDSKMYNELKCACVVIKNNIEYLSSLFEGDDVAISTWITKSDKKLRLSRFFQIIRINNNKTVFRSSVDYVCISLENFKPKKMPLLFQSSYIITAKK